MAEQRAVLVVEDEPLVRLDLATRLADAGYLIFEASYAAEAIGILERHPQIRVVFTDIQMPGDMDGLALAHYVRHRWPPTIIVVSSGRVQPGPGRCRTMSRSSESPTIPAGSARSWTRWPLGWPDEIHQNSCPKRPSAWG